jgi:hypothetical protein
MHTLKRQEIQMIQPGQTLENPVRRVGGGAALPAVRAWRTA